MATLRATFESYGKPLVAATFRTFDVDTLPPLDIACAMANYYTLADLQAMRKTTAVLSVFGDPVAHSLSPQLHNPALRALGIPGEYVRI